LAKPSWQGSPQLNQHFWKVQIAVPFICQILSLPFHSVAIVAFKIPASQHARIQFFNRYSIYLYFVSWFWESNPIWKKQPQRSKRRCPTDMVIKWSQSKTSEFYMFKQIRPWDSFLMLSIVGNNRIFDFKYSPADQFLRSYSTFRKRICVVWSACWQSCFCFIHNHESMV
jgi:hypothetical protein